MLLEAIEHRPKMNWAYTIDNETIQLRIRTKKDDVERVYVVGGDKYAWERTRGETPMRIFASDALFDYWECDIKPPYRRLKYGFKLESGSEQVWMNEDGFHFEERTNSDDFYEIAYINPEDVLQTPDWAKNAVFYQIFPERFANGDPSTDPENVQPWGGKPETDNFFGGDLEGVRQHLDYLTDLGVNALYFTPIFKAPSNHKYDTEDYLQLDPHFGDIDTLKRLIEECHGRGIRVVLDAVFNHSGRTFKPFVDVKENGSDSAYADWFHVREFPVDVKDGIPTYETFSFEPNMPKFNTGNPEVKKYLLEAAHYWIGEIGFDGWRLDVADEVDHRFWREFRTAVKTAKPDAYIVGELWHEATPWLQGDQFDSAMNYPFTYAVRDFVALGKTDARKFSYSLSKQLARYPLPVSQAAFNLLDSHDTERMLTVADGDKNKLKLAVAIQMTYPGTPCVYYGDEIGLDGGADPECRKCMEWDESKQDLDLRDFYKKMIALRLEHGALRTGRFDILLAEEGGRTLAYRRSDDDGKFVVALNVSDEARTIEVEEDGSWTVLIAGGAGEIKARSGEGGQSAGRALQGEVATTGEAAQSAGGSDRSESLHAASGRLAIELPAHGYAVLRAE
ncbi:glycoside hydrolase family 13 protein [Saccharibacillus sp. CPCC 101409]|uniref:glycoside hydrolase family 13 protein n=1 Tax=Saccharibacillus sp. CPCC 101409 TaxID=3058041 RepID=UPI002671A238|nr:glycoside hydrolase family 13 protein [Saccharibacillus sp. CPCC 101409]MDO3411353.1 glycoside hydrolase family 13 protein [Saccharibacillus sp. CPCC 101409]